MTPSTMDVSKIVQLADVNGGFDEQFSTVGFAQLKRWNERYWLYFGAIVPAQGASAAAAASGNRAEWMRRPQHGIIIAKILPTRKV
ncbi:hypothetical protein [Desulfatitalea alkaliphila]|uniref:Uncharacterized protein n=1 Tax=Desulfatitalea alkaliphila TaxID=2929485 RepID=A0AA41R7D0_9BACT|nr:hypothetical protein [Desulfatitalea alkaliphila]MCJ8502863.1 hypothetical protein [Desulfatitalea alkaliphila]